MINRKVLLSTIILLNFNVWSGEAENRDSEEEQIQDSYVQNGGADLDLHTNFEVLRPKGWPNHSFDSNLNYEKKVRGVYYNKNMPDIKFVNELLELRLNEDKVSYKEIDKINSTKALIRKAGIPLQDFNDYYFALLQLVRRMPNYVEEPDYVPNYDPILPKTQHYQNPEFFDIAKNCYNMNSNVGGEILIIKKQKDVCIRAENLINLSNLDITMIGRNDVDQLQTFYETNIDGAVILRNHSADEDLYVYALNHDVLILDKELENAQTIEQLQELSDEDKIYVDNYLVYPVNDKELAKITTQKLLAFDKHYLIAEMLNLIPYYVRKREKKQELSDLEQSLILNFDFVNEHDIKVQ